MQMHLLRGTIKYTAGKPKDHGYGEKINVVVTPSDGSDDIRVWGKPDDPIAQLRKGEEVQLFHDGKAYRIVSSDDPPASSNGNGSGTAAATASPAAEPVEPNDEDIRELVGIFRQLKKALPDAWEDTCRAFAPTVFMQRCRSEGGV
ncbi:hypothetical protein H6F43_03470 [Leptolyngbya sp. FACHB-36]|uniref:hypothetical protein n=1 Tax=Leptolyngbya sp. FACHB-36 TaxID=2692808 RepID=UPI001680B17B|nr:hypothetical protein [Leptolyngbya sp. FACHB-36]MBD2019241.1 hypothetical protein [Leptolyngbya sp. FACHB-36]